MNYFEYTPSPVLHARDDSSTSTPSTSSSPVPGSGGCITCPSLVPTTCANLKCAKGEVCQQTVQQCDKCPTYYCAAVANPQAAGGTPVGAIVGGVVGGAVALIVVGILYYYFVWTKSHPVTLSDDDIVMSGLDGYSKNTADDADNDSYVISNMDTHLGDSNLSADGSNASADGVERIVEKRPSNRRLSTYESFTRPQARHAGGTISAKKVQNRSINRLQQQKQLQQMQHQRSVYIDPNNPNRNSVATSISTTNASNILPIAYIPGVTVRPNKNNTRSIYSYENDIETESVFSDLNTIENASIIGGPRQQSADTQKDTMTAIKAQPRLVNVGMIEEEDEGDTDDDDDSDLEKTVNTVPSAGAGAAGAAATTASIAGAMSTASTAIGDDLHNTIMSDPLHATHLTFTTANTIEDTTFDETDSDVDSDVDSDIGEIVRVKLTSATYVGDAPKNAANTGANTGALSPHTPTHAIDPHLHHHIPIGIERPMIPGAYGALPQSSSHGSFLLDVDIIGTSPRGLDGAVLHKTSSPFDDPDPKDTL